MAKIYILLLFQNNFVHTEFVRLSKVFKLVIFYQHLLLKAHLETVVLSNLTLIMMDAEACAYLKPSATVFVPIKVLHSIIVISGYVSNSYIQIDRTPSCSKQKPTLICFSIRHERRAYTIMH